MNAAVLETLGDAAIVSMATQMGLRGARILPPALLRRGLRAAWAAAASAAEAREAWEEAAEAGPAEAALPPALRTETMARVLERQGRLAEAAALRRSLQGDASDGSAAVTATPISDRSPPVPLGPRGWSRQGVRVALRWGDRADGGPVLRLSVEAADPGSAQAARGDPAVDPMAALSVEWALFFPGGTRRVHREPLAKAGAPGEGLPARPCELERTPPRGDAATAAVVAVLERLPDGRRRPIARTPVWARGATRTPGGVAS